MTDQIPDHDPDILDAYRRLSGAALLAVDPVPGVQRGLRRRRTTRRAVAGVATLAVVGGIGGAVALTAGVGGDDLLAVDEPGAATAPASPMTSTLAFERADASTWTFRARTLEVSCTDTGRPGERLVLSTAEPVLAPGVGRALLEPVLRIDLATAGLRLPQTFTLPVPGASQAQAPVSLFVADPDGRGNAYELTSTEDGTSGTVTVDRASCGATPRLSLRVDAVLGGEVGRPDQTLTGRFRTGG